MVTISAPNAQDYVALAEIELCGELMIAASTAREERLSSDRIDEVLNVKADGVGDVDGVRDVGPVRVRDVEGVRDVHRVRDGRGEMPGVRGGTPSAKGAASGVRGAASGVRGVEAWAAVPRQAAHRG
ncbi:hypothetical protein [Streptomyces sp. NPDC007346]|uniref:hypothetical protein n=1 Tax=Streptomyces sp. NPDC007346 TaxID=3154682 RepID=UPI003452CE2A